MSYSHTLTQPGALPAGRYAVQLLAPRDAPPSARFAVERIGVRNVDDPVQAEFAICIHRDLVDRDLRNNDRVHVIQRYRGGLRNLIRRVETKGNSVLLYPVKTARGPKAKPIDAASVTVMGLVTGTFMQFRV